MASQVRDRRGRFTARAGAVTPMTDWIRGARRIDANEQLDGADLDRVRRLVARAAHLPDALSDRLRGGTIGELEADAERLGAATATDTMNRFIRGLS